MRRWHAGLQTTFLCKGDSTMFKHINLCRCTNHQALHAFSTCSIREWEDFIVLGSQLSLKALAEFLHLELSKSHFTHRNNHDPTVDEWNFENGLRVEMTFSFRNRCLNLSLLSKSHPLSSRRSTSEFKLRISSVVCFPDWLGNVEKYYALLTVYWGKGGLSGRGWWACSVLNGIASNWCFPSSLQLHW